MLEAFNSKHHGVYTQHCNVCSNTRDTPGSGDAHTSVLYPQKVQHSSHDEHLAFPQAPSCLLANLEQTMCIPSAWVSLPLTHEDEDNDHDDDGGDSDEPTWSS